MTLTCSWEVLQDLGSDHLPIILSILLSLVFSPMSVPLPSTFRKLAGMTFLFLILTVLLQRNIHLFLSFAAAALFTFLALNVAQSSIPFSHIKHHPKAWWSAEVEDVIDKRCKAFAVAHRSDEDRQAYIFAS